MPTYLIHPTVTIVPRRPNDWWSNTSKISMLKVEQIGRAACHQSYVSCFFRLRVGNELKLIAERVYDPQQVYDK